MAATHWISLPPHWKLSSVQAGVQVIIAVLCTLGIFVFARFCWQLSGLRVAKNRPVTLSSLISINTIGEAYDLFFLLKGKIFKRQYWRLLSQSIMVILLSAAAIISGPIAKASTKIGTLVSVQQEPGMLSNRLFNSLGYGYVHWSETAASLDQAGFPYDQLLDFVPNTNLTWVYRPEEWNSSWSMNCTTTDKTPVTLYDTGNCTGIYPEMYGLYDIFPNDNFDYAWQQWYGVYYNSSYLRDALLVIAGWDLPDTTLVKAPILSMSYSVIAITMHNLAKENDTTSPCWFGQGPVQESYYTKAECVLTRQASVPDPLSIAYPDHSDRQAVVEGYISNYIARLARESISGLPITGITAQELIRFYQVYLAVKDTFYQHPITRSISMKQTVVQISETFLIVAGVMLLLDIIGLMNYIWFMLKHWNVVIETPESKLDWAVQSIVEGPTMSPVSGKSPHSRWSVVAATTGSNMSVRKSERLRTYFENAKFSGSASEENIPLQRNPTSYSSNQSYMSPPLQNLASMSPYEAQFILPDYSASQFPNSDYNTTGYFPNNNTQGVQAPEGQAYRPWVGRGYQRLT